MKNNFQQPAAQVELDDQELEQITGGCSSNKKHKKHLPPPPPQHKSPVHHPGQPSQPYPGQSGNGFGGYNGKC